MGIQILNKIYHDENLMDVAEDIADSVNKLEEYGITPNNNGFHKGHYVVKVSYIEDDD